MRRKQAMGVSGWYAVGGNGGRLDAPCIELWERYTPMFDGPVTERVRERVYGRREDGPHWLLTERTGARR